MACMARSQAAEALAWRVLGDRPPALSERASFLEEPVEQICINRHYSR